MEQLANGEQTMFLSQGLESDELNIMTALVYGDIVNSHAASSIFETT